MTTENDRRSRLPKWAQDEIESLECQNEWLKKELAQRNGTVTEFTPIVVNSRWNGGPEQIPLDINARILYRLSSGAIHVRRVSNDGIELMGDSTDGISIEPASSNVAIVRLKRR